MNPLEIHYILRIIFAYLGEKDRTNIYNTCRIFRQNYLWVSPTDSMMNCIKHDNRTLANEILGTEREYITPNDTLFGESYTQNYPKLLELCIQYGIDPSQGGNFAIRHASEMGYLPIIEILLKDPRVDPSNDSNYPIIIASENGHLHVVDKLLMDPRVDPSANNNEAIYTASSYGNLDIVERLLLDPRVDPSDHDNASIHSALGGDHFHVVERLLMDSRIDPSDYHDEIIRTASEYGYLSIVG